MKKILHLGCVLSLFIAGFSLTNFVSAKEMEATVYPVQPVDTSEEDSLILCPHCNKESRVVVTYGPWFFSIEKECPNYPHGVDAFESRSVYIDYICSECGKGVYSNIQIEIRFAGCHGYF